MPFYWRVETEPVVELIAYELVSGQYREAVRGSHGVLAVPGPYPMVIDLDALSLP